MLFSPDSTEAASVYTFGHEWVQTVFGSNYLPLVFYQIKPLPSGQSIYALLSNSCSVSPTQTRSSSKPLVQDLHGNMEDDYGVRPEEEMCSNWIQDLNAAWWDVQSSWVKSSVAVASHGCDTTPQLDHPPQVPSRTQWPVELFEATREPCLDFFFPSLSLFWKKTSQSVLKPSCGNWICLQPVQGVGDC